jgi:hypothetical protein
MTKQHWQKRGQPQQRTPEAHNKNHNPNQKTNLTQRNWKAAQLQWPQDLPHPLAILYNSSFCYTVLLYAVLAVLFWSDLYHHYHSHYTDWANKFLTFCLYLFKMIPTLYTAQTELYEISL